MHKASPIVITENTWVYILIKWACWFVLKLVYNLRVEGLHNVPRTGAVVITPNHGSYLDPPVVAAAIGRHLAFMAKAELMNNRFMAFVVNMCGAIPVKRGERDRVAFEAILCHLSHQVAVVFFPEGTRSQNGELGELETGAIRFARQRNAKVVPAGIVGTHAAWPPGGKPHLKFGGQRIRITIRFGPPIDPKSPDAETQLAAAIRRLMT